jgi:sodium-coupled neutral amino acid transporter 7/8
MTGPSMFRSLKHLLTHTRRYLSTLFTTVFVGGSVGLALVVHDLGSALHVLGGTAASFMIFCLPGLMLCNAGIVKQSVGILDRMDQVRCS